MASQVLVLGVAAAPTHPLGRRLSEAARSAAEHTESLYRDLGIVPLLHVCD